MIGLYKYEYGFRITSRSALVDSLYLFLCHCNLICFPPEFDYVFRYLEVEQIGAIVHEQEKKAAWKTAQLHHIRESEEKKRQRNLEVENMKAEMLNLQIQLHSFNSITDCDDTSPASEGLRRRKNTTGNSNSMNMGNLDKQELCMHLDSRLSFDLYDSLSSLRTENPFAVEFAKQAMELGEITELEEDMNESAFTDADKEKKRLKAIQRKTIWLLLYSCLVMVYTKYNQLQIKQLITL